MRSNYFLSLTVFVLFLFVGSILTISETKIATADIKCLKCHRGKDSLDKYIKEKNIKSAQELRDLLRRGPKAGLHITNTDEDIEKAIRYLNLP